MQKTKPTEAMVALMGTTGREKSAFIHLLTGKSYVGDDLKYKTDVDVASYVADDGRSVTLVDTPGFDVSHEGVSDADIFERIAKFLQADGGRKLNGLIYMHRISEPRMDYMAKKGLEIFGELCGERNFANVRIVTTDWDGVDENEGETREKALSQRYFKHLIDGGAKMFRQDGKLKSARSIMSELVQQLPVTLKIQEELDAGRALGNTSAGAVIMKGMQKEWTDLKDEMGRESKAKVRDDWKRLQETNMVRQPRIGKSSLEPGKKGGSCPNPLVTIVVVVIAVGVLLSGSQQATT